MSLIEITTRNSDAYLVFMAIQEVLGYSMLTTSNTQILGVTEICNFTLQPGSKTCHQKM